MPDELSSGDDYLFVRGGYRQTDVDGDGVPATTIWLCVVRTGYIGWTPTYSNSYPYRSAVKQEVTFKAALEVGVMACLGYHTNTEDDFTFHRGNLCQTVAPPGSPEEVDDQLQDAQGLVAGIAEDPTWLVGPVVGDLLNIAVGTVEYVLDRAADAIGDTLPELDPVVEALLDVYGDAYRAFDDTFGNDLPPPPSAEEVLDTAADLAGESTDSAIDYTLGMAGTGLGLVMNLVSQLTSGDEIHLDAPTSEATEGPLPPESDPRERQDRWYWSADERAFVGASGEPATLRARGYNMWPAHETGGPCRVGGKLYEGAFRPECTAQSHAIRKLNSLARGDNRDFGYSEHVQWEVGGRMSGSSPDTACPSDNDSACEDAQIEESTASFGQRRWRADIVIDLEGPPDEWAAESSHGIFEVKQWSSTSPPVASVNSQLSVYLSNFEKRKINMVKSEMLRDFRNPLNGDKRGWAVFYTDACEADGPDAEPRTFYAWAPLPGDDLSSYTEAQLAGHIYFAQSGASGQTVPAEVVARARRGDVDWQATCKIEVELPTQPGLVIRPM